MDEIDTFTGLGVREREALDTIHKPRPGGGLGAHRA